MGECSPESFRDENTGFRFRENDDFLSESYFMDGLYIISGYAYTWVFLSLIAAFTLATSDAFTKKALTEKNEYLVAWFRLLFSFPFLVILWIFIPMPSLDKEFYLAFVFALPFEIIAIILYIKALKLSPLSLTLPFLSLTPLFLIRCLLRDTGGKSIFKGMVESFSAAGSYILNLREIRKGIVKPFRSMIREKGSVLMMGLPLFIVSLHLWGKWLLNIRHLCFSEPLTLLY